MDNVTYKIHFRVKQQWQVGRLKGATLTGKGTPAINLRFPDVAHRTNDDKTPEVPERKQNDGIEIHQEKTEGFSAEGFEGHGFVYFKTKEAAMNAIQKDNDMLLNKKKVFVDRFVPRKGRENELRKKFEPLKLGRLSRSRDVNLHVKNLDDTIDDERLSKGIAP